MKITLNNNTLSEVRMPIEEKVSGIQPLLSYPDSQFDYKLFENQIIIFTPAFLMVELLNKNILGEKNAPIQVSIDDKLIGEFIFDEITYPERRNGVHYCVNLKLKAK